MEKNIKCKLSVFILTKNSAKSLKSALESVKWAKEIIIIDGFSTDETLEIARQYKCKVFQQKFQGFDHARNLGIEKSTQDWIFEIDSDEEASLELQQCIKETITPSTNKNVFSLKRRDCFMRRHLIDLKLIRLYRKGILHYVGTTHEVVIFDKKEKKGKLAGLLFHNADDTDTLFQSVNKWDVETEREIISSKRFGKKRMGRIKLFYKMFIYPVIVFFGLLFYKGFIFKGMSNMIWAAGHAFYHFSIYAKYYEVHYLNIRKVNTSKLEFPTIDNNANKLKNKKIIK